MKKIAIISIFVAAFVFGAWSQAADTSSKGFGRLDSAPGQQNITAQPNPAFSKSKIRYYTPVDRDTQGATQAPGASAPIQENSDPFSITDSGPQGELPGEILKPTIYVVFSQPVVPLAKLGDVITNSPLMKITPPLKGVYRWYGTRMFAFESAEIPQPMTAYSVSVDPGVKSLGGKRLTGSTTFDFHFDSLKLLSLVVGDGRIKRSDIPPAEARTVTLGFSYPVEVSSVSTSIDVRLDESKKVAFTAGRPSNADGSIGVEEYRREVMLTFGAQLPENTLVSVTLRQGATASKGAFPTTQEQRLQFQTLLPFQFRDSQRYSWEFRGKGGAADSNPVYLVFSHPVKKESLVGRIKITPSIPLQESNLELWNTTVKVNNLPVAFDTTYSFTLDPGIEDIYGRKLGRQASFDVKIGNPFRYAWFPNEGVRMLEAQFPKKYVWESQDLLEGSWAIGPVDDPYKFDFLSSRFTPLDFSKIAPHTKHFEIVDLARFLNPGGKGWVGAQWKLQDYKDRQKHPTEHEISLQVTDLGLTVRYAYNKVVCFVSQLSTGKVVPGARVTLNDSKSDVRTATTDQRGVAVVTLNPGEFTQLFTGSFSANDYKHLRIRVESGDDKIVFEPNQTHNAWHNGVWLSSINRVETTRPQVFLFSDRRIYKPGETVTYRGIDRSLALGAYSSYQGGYTLRLRNTETDDQPITLKDTTTASGGFYGTIALPDTMKPGEYVMEYARAGDEKRTLQREPVTVSYFRRLLFTAALAMPDLTYYVGDSLSFRLKAEYLSGGNVTGASYDGYWTREPAYFQPAGPRWNAYVFGPGGDGETSDARTTLSSVKGALSAAGEVEVKQATTKEGVVGQAYAYRLQVNVTDTASSQMVGVSKGVLVHPADFYIGGKLSPGSRYYAVVEKNGKVSLDVALARPDGSPYAAAGGSQPVDVEVRLIEWKVAQQQAVGDEVNTRYERVVTQVNATTLDAADGTAQWSFVPSKTGAYTVTLKATDRNGRQAVTVLSLYVTGSEWIRWYSEGAADINLIADKPIYAAGDTAKIMMQSPVPAGTYLVTIEREGIQEERVIELTGSTQVIEVPVKEEYLPVIYVAVSSYTVRQGPPTHTFAQKDLDKPKGLFGVVPLRVESKLRRIDLEVVAARDIYRPGTEAEFTIRAKNRDMSLAGAEITFMVVDRGVVDLVDYHVPDPVKFFYAPEKFPLAVSGADSRSLLIDPVTYEVKDLHGGDAEESKISERKDFNPTAYFQPYLLTGGNGEVKVKFKLPDSLTTYRCTAVAVKDNLLGLSESDLKVQNPINVRAYLPRRMRIRDTASAGVIVTNLDAAPRKVTIECSSTLVTVDGDVSKTLTVQPGATVEVPFNLAAEKVGTGEVVFTLTSAVLKERLREPFIVEQPYLFETVATIGKIMSAVPQKGAVGRLLDKALNRNQAPVKDVGEEGVILPSGTPDGKGTLRLTVDSTRVSTLGPAFSWLFHYPYGCLEQRSSRLLPLVAFGPYISTFGIDTEVVDVKGTVEKELSYIASCQLPGGGFPLWPNESEPYYYVSLRVAHIYALAKDAGYRMPRMNVDGLFSYLDSNLEKLNGNEYLRAYKMYVASLFKRADKTQVDDVAKKAERLGFAGYGMTGLAYLTLGDKRSAGAMLQKMKNLTRPNTRSIDVTEPAASRHYDWDSDIGGLSLYLMLSHKLDPQSDMIQRIITTLYDHQTAGYWYNTTDTNWALQALAQVIRAEEKEKPQFTGRVLLNGLQLFSHDFSGIKADRQVAAWELTSPELKPVPRDRIAPLRFEKEGPGTLYYAAELRYAIPSELAVARDEGLGVFSEIQTMDGAAVQGQTLTVGQVYRMKAMISTSKRRTFVAVRLPIPSGCEVLDANLATSGTYGKRDARQDDSDYDYPRYHREILDNEVQFFLDEVYGGQTEVDFLFRAVIPGIYPTPPVTAEGMYEPEVFGRDIGRLMTVTKAQ